MSTGAGIDYSVWDHIYVSDDEDVTSPFVDTPSLFRMRHRVSSETSSGREVWSRVATWLVVPVHLETDM